MPNIDLSTSARLFRNGNEIFQIYKGEDLIWQKLNPYVYSVHINGTGEVGFEHSCAVIAHGSPSPVIEYQWRLDGADIPGAKNATYIIRSEDVGNLSCLGIAHNTYGCVRIISNEILVVSSGIGNM